MEASGETDAAHGLETREERDVFTWRLLQQILGDNFILLRGEAGMSMAVLKGVFIIPEMCKPNKWMDFAEVFISFSASVG